MNNKPRYNRWHKAGMILCILGGVEFVLASSFGFAGTRRPRWFVGLYLSSGYCFMPTLLLGIAPLFWATGDAEESIVRWNSNNKRKSVNLPL